MKLKKVTLKNFRGARGEDPLNLELGNGLSALIYGDNGTGKSSFTDAVEWIVKGKVKHLKGIEVGGNHGGLKNTFTAENDESYAALEFDDQYVLKKNLSQRAEKFAAKFSKPESDEEFSDVLNSDHLFIRNRELVPFMIDNTATERLKGISNIIGFQALTDTKDIFTKVSNSLRKVMSNQNYEVKISTKKEKIVEKLKAKVNTKEQFYSSITNELRKLKIDKIVADGDTLQEALQELKKGLDEEEIVKQNKINTSEMKLEEGLAIIKSVLDSMSAFAMKLKKLKSDNENITNISVYKLLEEGEKILSFRKKDGCPLCEYNIGRETLLALIKDRLKALKEVKEKIKNLTDEKNSLQTNIVNINNTLDSAYTLLVELNLDEVDIKKLKSTMSLMKSINEVMNEDMLAIDEKKLTLQESDVISVESTIQILKKIGQSEGQKEAEKKIELYSAITLSCETFEEILMLEKEKGALELQKETMDTILTLFNEVRKKEMEKFLNAISSKVNEFYLYMNSDDKVDEIKLIPTVSNDGDLTGMSFEFNFHGQPVSSPKKYLSESYINCLGLCVFLASVKLFNTKAKFFILDDVISSFDKRHRTRFGNLLLEKFSDFQIIALTHEHEWFAFMRNTVREKNWKTLSTKWCVEKGTYFSDSPITDIKEKIESKIKKDETDGLGNDIRKFAEQYLKKLCYNLAIPLPFRYNDKNEDRMSAELLDALVGRVNKKSNILMKNAVVNKLKSNSFFTAKASHDTCISENIDDFKVVFKDLIDLYNLFFCESCGQFVNYKFVNTPKKTISCRCGKKELDWK